METVAFVLFGLVLYMHFWTELRLSHPGEAGIISAAAGVTLLALIIFKPLSLASRADPALVSVLVALMAIYALAIAANNVWNLELRSLGFASIFVAGSFVILGAAFILVPATQAVLLGVVTLMVAVPLVFTFIQVGLLAQRLRPLTAVLHVAAGAIAAVLALIPAYGFLSWRG